MGERKGTLEVMVGVGYAGLGTGIIRGCKRL